MIYTTYNLAVKHNACERALESWDKHVGGIKKFGADTPIPLTDILEVLGIDDCLWAFRAVQDEEVADTIILKFLTAVADKWLIHFESKYPQDKRPCKAFKALRDYFLNPSYKAAVAVDSAYKEAIKADLSKDDRDYLWLLAGGDWTYSSYCGSRFRSAYNDRWYAASTIGGRALSEAEKKWQTAKLQELLEEA